MKNLHNLIASLGRYFLPIFSLMLGCEATEHDSQVQGHQSKQSTANLRINISQLSPLTAFTSSNESVVMENTKSSGSEASKRSKVSVSSSQGFPWYYSSHGSISSSSMPQRPYSPFKREKRKESFAEWKQVQKAEYERKKRKKRKKKMKKEVIRRMEPIPEKVVPESSIGVYSFGAGTVVVIVCTLVGGHLKRKEDSDAPSKEV